MSDTPLILLQIDRKFRVATSKRDFKDILEQLKALHGDEKYDAEAVRQRFNDLAEKALYFEDEIKRFLMERGETWGDDGQFDDLREEIENLYYARKYSGVIEFYDSQWRPRGLRDPIVDGFYKRAKERLEDDEAGFQVTDELPFAAIALINRALSSLRVGAYQDSLSSCEEAVGILEREGYPIPSRLIEIQQTAEYRRELQIKIDDGLKYIEDGDWENALREWEKVEAGTDERLTQHITDLREALKDERSLEIEIQGIRHDDLDAVTNLANLERRLNDLPNQLGDYVKPTARQARMQQQIEQHRNELERYARREGKISLELAKEIGIARRKDELLAEAIKHLNTLVLLTVNDDEASELLNEARRLYNKRQLAADRWRVAISLTLFFIVIFVLSIVIMTSQSNRQDYLCQGVVHINDGLVIYNEPSTTANEIIRLPDRVVLEIYAHTSSNPEWFLVGYEFGKSSQLQGWALAEHIVGVGCPASSSATATLDRD